MNYIDSMLRHFDSDLFVIERFTIGKRVGCESNLFYILTCLCDYARLFFKLFSKEYKIIHLNPSLGKVPVLRDGLFLLISKLHSKKVLVYWHGWSKEFQNKLDSNSILLNYFKLIFGSADVTLVLSSAFMGKLKEWNFKNRIIVDTTTFDDSLAAGYSFEQKINEIKGTGKLTMLFLSRLEVAKGIMETIEAFTNLKNVGREIELVIAGDGPAYNLVKEYVDKSGDKRIQLVGYVRGDSKREILEKSHLMLLPTSYGEGLPVCLLEAMVFGIPLITTPVGGIPDNFIEGENGYYLHNITGNSLAKLIRTMLTDKDDLARIGVNNYHFSRKKFPASIVSQRLETIYQQLVAG